MKVIMKKTVTILIFVVSLVITYSVAFHLGISTERERYLEADTESLLKEIELYKEKINGELYDSVEIVNVARINKPALGEKLPQVCVPNGRIAAQLALVISKGKYGSRVLNESPFKVSLEDDSVWVVSGTRLSKIAKGGTIYAEIRKKDGAILRIEHGK